MWCRKTSTRVLTLPLNYMILVSPLLYFVNSDFFLSKMKTISTQQDVGRYCVWISLETFQVPPQKLVAIIIARKVLESEITQSCLTLCDPMDCSLPVSSVRGISQVRILERVVISFSRGSSQPRDWTWVSHIAGTTVRATREAYLRKWPFKKVWLIMSSPSMAYD